METSSVLRISRPSKTPSLLPYDKNFKWIRELRGAGATHKGGRMAGVEGLEPPTLGLEIRCSILLSYTPSIIYTELLAFVAVISQLTRRPLLGFAGGSAGGRTISTWTTSSDVSAFCCASMKASVLSLASI